MKYPNTGEILMLPEWIRDLPWDMFDTLINFTELLVLFVPATVAFMYYKVQSVSLSVYNITDYGATLLIHNKTNRSIFISDIKFIANTNCSFSNPVVNWNKTIFQLKPDDYVEVIVNYTKDLPDIQIFHFFVHYDKKRIKKIKVKV